MPGTAEEDRVRLQAAKLLGGIVRDGTVKLSKAVVVASRTKLTHAFNRVTRRQAGLIKAAELKPDTA